MNPTQDDLNWLDQALRSEFDIATWINEESIIERAERFGRIDLAEEMKADSIHSKVELFPGTLEMLNEITIRK